jgi:hypothetical protein
VGQGEMMAVAADRLLHDPNLRDVLDGMSNSIDKTDPYTEQLIAAADEASALLGHGDGACGSAEAAPWIRLGAMTALTKWGLHEDVRLCSHEPHHMRPQPVFAAAFMPNAVVCQKCVGLLFQDGDRHLCNGCGTRREAECYIGTMQIAAMTWMFHLCAECHEGLPDATMTCDGDHDHPECDHGSAQP